MNGQAKMQTQLESAQSVKAHIGTVIGRPRIENMSLEDIKI